MKALITYALVLIFMISTSYGQNYQTIQSDEIHYFSTQTYEYYLASKTVNVDVQGADSVFYSYQTVREDENLNQGDPCKYYLGASWLGEQIEIKADGRNIFYNKDGEAITIQTQAALNDTFLVYSYPNGDWIRGVVSNQLQVSIFGELDNLKIIELFSNVAFPYSNNRIMLSENHGFVETFAFYNFPNPYQGVASINGQNHYPEGYDGNFRLVGIDTAGFHKPVALDLYDYEIGDVIKLSSKEETMDITFDTFVQKKVINKFVWPGDSTVYFIEETIQEIQYPLSGASETNLIGPFVKTYVIQDNDGWMTPYLPEEYNGSDGWSVIVANNCGDIEEISRTEGISLNGSCLDVDLNFPALESSSINGVGQIGLNGESNGVIYSNELVFYQKPYGVSCGQDQVLSISDEQDPVNSIYPNPILDHTVLKVSGGGEHIITVVDESGKVVRVWKVPDAGEIALDLTDLESGVYLLLDENQNGIQRNRIVKL